MTDLELFSTEETTKILVELGVPANLQGFKYLQHCIVNVIQDPNKIKKVTKKLYPIIGEKYKVNGSVVERSIRHATDIAYFKTGFKSLPKLFGLEENYVDSKPTNCELIAMIAEALRFKCFKAGLLA